jgi:hypothetical protein
VETVVSAKECLEFGRFAQYEAVLVDFDSLIFADALTLVRRLRQENSDTELLAASVTCLQIKLKLHDCKDPTVQLPLSTLSSPYCFTTAFNRVGSASPRRSEIRPQILDTGGERQQRDNGSSPGRKSRCVRRCEPNGTVISNFPWDQESVVTTSTKLIARLARLFPKRNIRNYLALSRGHMI